MITTDYAANPAAVIIAGGRGTRLGLQDLPKPMAPVLGKPLLQYQIELLASSGIRDITILAGYRADKISDFFGDGEGFGVTIKYRVEDAPLGTAGAVHQLAGVLRQDFLVLYGDVFVDMDLGSFITWHRAHPSMGSVVVHPNDHPHDSDLVACDSAGWIQAFIPKPHPEGLWQRNLVNAALYLLSPEVFRYIPNDAPSDFAKDVFPAILAAGKTLGAYSTPEYLKDVGTPERLASVCAAISSGKTERRNKRHPQKAIFLDRDGVINPENGGVFRPQQFSLLPDIAQAIKRINDSEYLAIVVTNQPYIAKGQMSFADLEAVHACLDTMLGRQGAYLDGLYFCPHHPEKGWEGEVPELKLVCDCRKPATGMFTQAARDFNIDLTASWMIGDRLSDIQAGILAGCRQSFLVGSTEPDIPATQRHFANAAQAITVILDGAS